MSRQISYRGAQREVIDESMRLGGVIGLGLYLAAIAGRAASIDDLASLAGTVTLCALVAGMAADTVCILREYSVGSRRTSLGNTTNS